MRLIKDGPSEAQVRKDQLNDSIVMLEKLRSGIAVSVAQSSAARWTEQEKAEFLAAANERIEALTIAINTMREVLRNEEVADLPSGENHQ